MEGDKNISSTIEASATCMPSSSLGNEDKNISSTIEASATCMPSSSLGNEDHRVICKNIQSLYDILDITLGQISELSNFCNPNDRSDFVSNFSDSFKNMLQENIVLDGLPLSLDKSSERALSEKEDHKEMIDVPLLSKLSEKVEDVAYKRKNFPAECSRILQIQMKHDLKNLKKAKVISSSVSSVTSPRKDRSPVKEKFSNVCKDFITVQKTAQNRLSEKDKLAKKISLASDIKKQRPCLKSTLGDTVQYKQNEKEIHSENN